MASAGHVVDLAPFNHRRRSTSTCYLQCYTKAVTAMTKEELKAPWVTAFSSDDPASGGCPPAPPALWL